MLLQPKGNNQMSINCWSNEESITQVNDYDDLNDYEYSSDGKRMRFINYITGDVVYHEDALFHKLKKNMLYSY